MSGIYLTDMAHWLRSAGLNVIEQAGWQTRARSSGGYASGRPWCIMWHHTASNPSSDGQGDVNYIISADSAPISNLYINRAGTVWVIAAGATNTNGKGGPVNVSRGQIPLDQMNTYAVGIEVANNGVGEAWPEAQIDAFFATSIALTQALGLQADDVCSHSVYAAGRKIDPAQAHAVQGAWRPTSVNASGSWSLDDIKSECRARANGALPPPPKEDIMFNVVAVRDHSEALGGNMDSNGIIAQITWLNPNRYNACIQAGAPILTVSLNELANCDLLGPCPPSMNPGAFANHIE